MEIHAKSADRNLLLEIHGELDHHGAKGLMEQIDRLMEQNLPSKTILDLAELTFMDSSGIGFIVGRYKYAARRGGETIAAAAQNSIKRLMVLSGLHRIIDIYDSLDDAVRKFERR